MIRKTLFLLLGSLFLMIETFAGELSSPKAVVVHWTASNTWESAYNHFYHEARADGTLNVASHFLVSRDGKQIFT